mmetsp:Transcript_26367/g.59711  ORF Transcript_26367/g.59711 Transcript_26367/m.59711 type:complete len:190 (-) Transcript_26367:430-999(-)
MDRYLLACRGVKRSGLQLAGIACLTIATKYEEIFPNEIRDYVEVSDGAVTREAIITMEVQVLNQLNFKITIPTGFRFLEMYSKVNQCDHRHFCMAHYLTELMLPEYEMLQFAPSLIACAALFLSNKIFQRHPAWPTAMVDASGFADSNVKTCARAICVVLQRADSNKFQAVRRKFSAERFHDVASAIIS